MALTASGGGKSAFTIVTLKRVQETFGHVVLPAWVGDFLGVTGVRYDPVLSQHGRHACLPQNMEVFPSEPPVFEPAVLDQLLLDFVAEVCGCVACAGIDESPGAIRVRSPGVMVNAEKPIDAV